MAKRNSISYVLARGLWNLFSLTPLRVMYIISDVLFYPFFYLVRYRRKVAHNNLMAAFPEKSTEEINRIEKQLYRFLLDVFLEISKYSTISEKTIRKRMVFENVDEVNQLLAQGKSISLYLGHYCNWEWISSMPLHLKGKNVQAGQIYHRLSSPLSDRLLLENRERMGAISVEMKQTIRWVKDRQDSGTTTIVGYIADQSPKKRDSKHFLTFLNHNTPVMIGAEKITKRYNMQAYFLDVVRTKRGYYKATFVRMHHDPASLPDIKLTEIYYDLLEKNIRKHPEFYLWTHKRFRNATIIKTRK